MRLGLLFDESKNAPSFPEPSATDSTLGNASAVLSDGLLSSSSSMTSKDRHVYREIVHHVVIDSDNASIKDNMQFQQYDQYQDDFLIAILRIWDSNGQLVFTTQQGE